MILLVITFFFLIFVNVHNLYANEMIRVLIGTFNSGVEVECINGVFYYGNDRLSSTKDVKLMIKNGLLYINKKEYVSGKRLRCKNGFLRLKNKRYSGDIILYIEHTKKNKPSRLMLVNELDLETYVMGVLPSEMPLSWPIEALKAQAVCARTYAVYRKYKNEAAHYHLTADVLSQVYSGLSRINKRVKEVIYDTKGEVLTYHMEPVLCAFHSCCGGRTTDASIIWGKRVDYLRSVSCPFDRGCPSRKWVWKVDKGRLSDLLGLKNSIRSVELKRVKGVVRNIVVVDNKGKRKIYKVDRFREKIGYSRLKSPKFLIEKKGKEFIFKGTGTGHGIGLCQWGAKGLAERGKKYKDILRHYFRGITIQKMY